VMRAMDMLQSKGWKRQHDSKPKSRKDDRTYWLKSRVYPWSRRRQKALNVLPTMILSWNGNDVA
jgi:hypothetical protein